jgi:hypothetical protein
MRLSGSGADRRSRQRIRVERVEDVGRWLGERDEDHVEG